MHLQCVYQEAYFLWLHNVTMQDNSGCCCTRRREERCMLLYLWGLLSLSACVYFSSRWIIWMSSQRRCHADGTVYFVPPLSGVSLWQAKTFMSSEPVYLSAVCHYYVNMGLNSTYKVGPSTRKLGHAATTYCLCASLDLTSCPNAFSLRGQLNEWPIRNAWYPASAWWCHTFSALPSLSNHGHAF